jgi:hypothetical protein
VKQAKAAAVNKVAAANRAVSEAAPAAVEPVVGRRVVEPANF